jgi:hypothetical protein
MLLTQAQVRLGDNSELGRHLSVVGLDGVAELAIGLCLSNEGLDPPQYREGLPRALDRMVDHLGEGVQIEGVQGFKQLHRARNAVQHEGVLPDAEQIPDWYPEVEKLVRSLVAASFGVELSEVASADGVDDDERRELLKRAERALDDGDADTSFDASWDALSNAREEWQGRGGTWLSVRSPSGSLAGSIFAGVPSPPLPSSRTFENDVRRAIANLNERLELSTFTAELDEWAWLRDRRQDDRVPVTAEEAKRAFVFVLSWVLRMEAHIKTYPSDRAERWKQEQDAPRTGLPGGPHIRSMEASRPESFRPNRQRFVIQLTDLPEEHSEDGPDAIWAFREAAGKLGYASMSEPIQLHLGTRGQLHVDVERGTEPEKIWVAVNKLIQEAPKELEAFAENQKREIREDRAAVERYQADLSEVPFEIESVEVMRPWGSTAPRGIHLEIGGLDREDTEWLNWALEQTIEGHLPEPREPGNPFRSFGGAEVTFPDGWPAEKVASWIEAALDLARERASERASEEKAIREEDEATLHTLRELAGERVAEI